MATSTVPAVCAALYAKWAADSTLPAAAVVQPGWQSSMAERLVGYVGDVEGVQEFGAMGGPPNFARTIREEKYQVTATVEARVPGYTIVEAQTLAWSVMGALLNVLATDPTLGGVTGLVVASPGTYQQTTEWLDETTPLVLIELAVNCTGWLT